MRALDEQQHRELVAHVAGLNSVLRDQLPSQVQAGSVDTNEWTAAHRADEWLSANRVLLPRSVTDAFESLLRSFMEKSNDFLGWMRAQIDANRHSDQNTTAELRSRYSGLCEAFETSARDFLELIEGIRTTDNSASPAPDLSTALELADQHSQTMQDGSMGHSVDKRSVFVVYGRNLPAYSAVCDLLFALGLRPVEFDVAAAWTGKASPYVGEVLETAFRRVQAVVLLHTPDEEARLTAELGDDRGFQPRPNVLFESGMAFGMHAERTVIVELGPLRGLSDTHGRLAVRVSRDPEWRNRLASKLKAAGCSVDTDGSRWLSVGRDALEGFQGPDYDPEFNSHSNNGEESTPAERLLIFEHQLQQQLTNERSGLLVLFAREARERGLTSSQVQSAIERLERSGQIQVLSMETAGARIAPILVSNHKLSR